MNLRDFIQDGQVFLGMKGVKMKPLEKLCDLMNKNGIKPDIYTGHSLGGLMAMAAYSAIEKHKDFVPTVNSIDTAPDENDRKVYVFDSAPANKKTKRAFNMSHHLGAQDNTDPIINTHLDAADSLREKVQRAMQLRYLFKPKSHNTSPSRLDLPQSMGVPLSHTASSSSHKLTNIAESVKNHFLKRSENLEKVLGDIETISSDPIQKQIAQWQAAVDKFEQLAKQLPQGETQVTLEQIEAVMVAEENAMQKLLNLNTTLKTTSHENKVKHRDKIEMLEQLVKRLNTTKGSLASTMASPHISSKMSQHTSKAPPLNPLSKQARSQATEPNRTQPSSANKPLSNNTDNASAPDASPQSSTKGRVQALVDRFEAMK